MGQSAYVNTNFPVKAVKTPRSLRLRFDVPLLLVVLALVVIGIMFVYSSSWQYASYRDRPVDYMLGRQLVFAGIGITLAVVLSLFDYHRYQRLLIPMVLLMLGALILVLVVKDEINGNVRTLFNGSIQPSEFAKP